LFLQAKAAGRPVIFSFWHNQIFSATYFWRNRNIAVITSRHLDGEVIARVIGGLGYLPARGSSTRGSTRALLELRRHLERKMDAALTVDGPRGPIHKVKPGPLWLSSKTGTPILPFHIQPRNFWRLRSWDRFQIPKPLTAVLVKIGEPFTVPAGDEPESWMIRYQQEMDRIRSYCEAYWQKRTAGR